MILTAIRQGISAECTNDSDNWTLIGIISIILSVLLTAIVLMILLMICICYFTYKTKSTTNGVELTS